MMQVTTPLPLPRKTIHHNAICDECGTRPIVGIRYKSTRFPNYDICELCLKDNHDNLADGFVPLVKYTDNAEGKYYEPPGQTAVQIFGFRGFEQVTRFKDISTVVDMTLNTGSRLDLTSERYHNFVDAIAGKKSLKKFHLYINGECNLIEGIADGITRNKFVEHVEWNFPHTGLLTESAMTALCQMIQNCPSLRFLSFRIISQSVFPNREEDDEDPPPSSTKASTSYDQMASRFFTAFMTSRNVRSFSFYIPASAKGLSDDNKETALQAMQVNGNLKRIIARFQNADYRLNMLKTDKRYHWTERWNDLNATDLERVQVMEEILAVSDLDQVTVLFHFLREQPEILPVYYE